MNMALGDKEGFAKINVTQSAVFNSLLPQLPAATTFDSEAQVVGVESVRVARLDDIFAELPRSKSAFLKIDTRVTSGKFSWGLRSAYPTFSASRWNFRSSTFTKEPGSSMRLSLI
jgi:hypothetical protein